MIKVFLYWNTLAMRTCRFEFARGPVRLAKNVSCTAGLYTLLVFETLKRLCIIGYSFKVSYRWIHHILLNFHQYASIFCAYQELIRLIIRISWLTTYRSVVYNNRPYGTFSLKTILFFTVVFQQKRTLRIAVRWSQWQRWWWQGTSQ